MDRLSAELQRHLSSFAWEGSSQTRKGDVLFGGGRRDIVEDQSECRCGICVSTEAPTTAACTLLSDGHAHVVRRESTEICLPVCISRYPLRMCLKFIRSIIIEVALRIPVPERLFVRVTLQVDDLHDRRPRSLRPYLLNADLSLDDDVLEIDFLRNLDQDAHDVSMAYTLGDRIPEDAVPPAVPAQLERAIIEGNGRAFSLVLVAPGLPEVDFNIGSIRFRFEAVGFRAHPLYLFVQAAP